MVLRYFQSNRCVMKYDEQGVDSVGIIIHKKQEFLKSAEGTFK